MKLMTKKNTDRRTLTMERYLHCRLSILSSRVSMRIAQTYGDKFAISVTEWRIMAVLGEYPGISADEVSNKTQIEKLILSRAISKLLNRNLRNRERDPADKRRSMLKLSKTDQSVYDEIVPIAYDMEKELPNCFNAEETGAFSKLVDRLYEHARQLGD